MFVFLAWALSKTARRFLRNTASHLLHLDVEEVFSNSREASEDLRRELRRASEITVLTGRGAELQRETFEDLFRRSHAGRSRCRILLPQLDVPAGSTAWIDDREVELQCFDPAFGNGLLRRQVAATYDYLRPFTPGQVEVRGYNVPHFGRTVVTERVVYLTPYRSDRHGRMCPVIKYRRGETYDMLVRLLDKLWQDGRPME